jgi:hypothetical protein
MFLDKRKSCKVIGEYFLEEMWYNMYITNERW